MGRAEIEHGGSGAFWLRALEPHDPRAMLKALISGLALFK